MLPSIRRRCHHVYNSRSCCGMNHGSRHTVENLGMERCGVAGLLNHLVRHLLTLRRLLTFVDETSPHVCATRTRWVAVVTSFCCECLLSRKLKCLQHRQYQQHQQMNGRCLVSMTAFKRYKQSSRHLVVINKVILKACNVNYTHTHVYIHAVVEGLSANHQSETKRQCEIKLTSSCSRTTAAIPTARYTHLCRAESIHLLYHTTNYSYIRRPTRIYSYVQLYVPLQNLAPFELPEHLGASLVLPTIEVNARTSLTRKMSYR